MNKYLIFRTDRIGDFLVSAILIKCIKINDPSSEITVIASKNNYSYISTFPLVDNVIELKNNFFSKLKLISEIKDINFKRIIIHDSKKRSSLISFFLKSNKIIKVKNPDKINHIDIIKNILTEMSFSFFDSALDFLSKKKSKSINEKDYVQFHFDEKWIHNEYVNHYVNIEPTKDELISLIQNIKKKTRKKILITTGKIIPKILNELIPEINKLDIKIFKDINFIKLEEITSNANILIACHGAISHVAAAYNIKQIDIIDRSYNYTRWTKHFRNYNYLYRNNFISLKNEISKLL